MEEEGSLTSYYGKHGDFNFMETFSPVVITSKPATEHLNKIKAEHADVLTGIQNQSLKVEQYNMQKDAERKDKIAVDTQNAKDNVAISQKNKELAIKEQALTSI